MLRVNYFIYRNANKLSSGIPTVGRPRSRPNPRPRPRHRHRQRQRHGCRRGLFVYVIKDDYIYIKEILINESYFIHYTASKYWLQKVNY